MKQITNKIYSIRNQQVMLDEDLAFLYGVPTGTLNQAVKRNKDRFPKEFWFQLTRDEFSNLKSQIAISSLENNQNNLIQKSNLKSQIVISSLHGGRRQIPHAFTEQGIAMLSAVLKSDIAM